MSAAAPLPPYPNGGPVGYNDPRWPGAGGSPERAFAHFQDLQAMSQEGYNPSSSILTLLDTADHGLAQAKTLVDFRRPDLAFVEYLRASDILVTVIPHHKDYTHFTLDQPERAQKYFLLRKKVNAMNDQFVGIKGIIVNNNQRTGARPQRGQPSGGHVRTESAPATHMNGHGGSPEGHRIKPTPSPKPDNMHGRPLSNATSGSNGATSNADVLSERFARLRALDTAQRPESRASNASSVHSSPISMHNSGGYPSRSSFDTLSRMDSAGSRPQGPRGMHNGATAPMNIPNFPQEPPAAYSPARNMQTTGNIAPPRHSARSLASGRRTSMAPASAASAHAPNGYAQSGEYFPASAPSSNGAARPQERRRTSVNMTTEAFIGAERFHDYLDRFNILLIDFRARAEFDQGHIYARNVMCIEPLSMRQGMSAEDLADTLVLSPDYEQELFFQREKYDLVVYYDNDTQAVYPFRDSRHAGLRYLHEALWDFNQEKRLQRPPILLRQGIAGWVDLVGEQALLTTNTLAKMKVGRQNIQRRPLASASISGGSQLRVPKRRLRNYDQLDAEEEQSWRERARAESVVLPYTPGLPEDGQQEEGEYEEEGAPDSAIKEFLERFPEAGNLDRQAFASQLPNRAPPEPPAKVPLPSYPSAPPSSAYPSVPARPVPAAPRMSYTGVSDRAVSASTPTSRSSSSQLAPYIPPKYLATNLRLPRTGLVNFGNTCYMNSTLQALSATPPLSVFFMDDAFRAQLQRDSWKGSKGVLAEFYANLIRSLWKGDVECIRPTTFRNFCKRLNNAFNNDDQQDAKEYLDFLLDQLHEDLNAMWARTPLRMLTEQEEAKRERMPKLIVARTEWGRYTHRELSFITSLFAGQHASKLTCMTCGFTSTTYEAFTTISVEIPPEHKWSGRLPTLQDCLSSYCSEERLTRDEQWHCTRCQTTREALKRITLTRAPQYLVVHFKRFAQQGRTARKIRVPVDFPLNDLDLAPYMLPQPTKEEAELIVRDYGLEALRTDAPMTPPYRYDAYAVVRHLGQTMQAGHYVTAAKDQARKCWHWYNDKLVADFHPEQQAPGSSEDLRSGDAYIVFYQRNAPAVYGGKM
ncbi:hypothetical protein LTR36_006507 [Oleoguttula mirabilis]|uniref:USP domain-containing protein n=1 Tax=Oleoguttula mirabilis TaxID=1507867 RepID=A0AAV9JUV8_9PEZI|nr:hypothetical protein LTR36_006507 [Oleoguttula mirabilis]